MVCGPCYTPGHEYQIIICLCRALESAIRQRLSAIKVDLELQSVTYHHDTLDVSKKRDKHLFLSVVGLAQSAIRQKLSAIEVDLELQSVTYHHDTSDFSEER